MDFKELWNMGKMALDMEKAYESMTREEMILVGYGMLGAHIKALAVIIEQGTHEDVEAWTKNTVALRKLLEPYEAEYQAMIEKEGEHGKQSIDTRRERRGENDEPPKP